MLVHIQNSHALGPMNLMAADAQHIDTHFFRQNPELSIALHRIHMEQNGFLPVFQKLSNLLNGLHCADLIIYIHNGHQNGFIGQSRFQIRDAHHALFIHRQIRHLKALLFQLLHGIQDGRMLNPGGNQVLSRPLIGMGCAHERQVITLCSTGGKIDLLGLHLQIFRNDFFRLADIFLRVHALLM